MTATSFDRTAQWIGPKAWRILHTAGSYYVWLIFANSYVGRALQMPAYSAPAILLVAALALRLALPLYTRRQAKSLRSTTIARVAHSETSTRPQ